MATGGWCAEPVASPEYRVKAAFLFNFVKFVEWPARAFGSSSSELVIGVLGSDPFGGTLDQLLTGEVAGGHPIVARRVTTADACRDCHIVFVAPSERGREGAVLTALAGRPILLVSDLDGFAEHGGAIALTNKDNRVRLRINTQAATAAGLILSSKLLSLADVVGTNTEH